MPTQERIASGRSTEYFGQGQSGYTAGRVEGDPALQLQLEARNASYPPGTDDEQAPELDTDERFRGAGRAPWAPPEADGEQRGA